MVEPYYKSKESVKEYIQLAKGVNGSALIERLIPFLKVGGKLLELGSGPGTDWNILTKHYQVIGSDFSKEFLDHLKSSFPSGEFCELDAITIETKATFDGIYSNKVLHHLTDAELHESVKRQCEVLNPRGIICHSFWEGEGSETFKGMFVNYHTSKELDKVFEPYFDLLLLEKYKEFNDGDSILAIARKK
ncbi:MAG: class I SAM-dependent methyltransferase [Vicingaceae bacterium]